ncbi:MAG: hypothetical protein ACR2PY_02825 [Salinispira sp.]
MKPSAIFFLLLIGNLFIACIIIAQEAPLLPAASLYGVYFSEEQEIPEEVIAHINNSIMQSLRPFFQLTALAQRIPVDDEIKERAAPPPHQLLLPVSPVDDEIKERAAPPNAQADIEIIPHLQEYTITSDTNNDRAGSPAAPLEESQAGSPAAPPTTPSTAPAAGYLVATLAVRVAIVHMGERVADIDLKTIGYSPSEEGALKQAVDELSAHIRVALAGSRALPGRQTAIVETFEDKVIISSRSAVAVGNEYKVRRLVHNGINSDWEDIALLRVREVREEYSIANVIFKESPLLISDYLQQLPRSPLSIYPHVAGSFNLTTGILDRLSAGVKMALSTGVYDFRPLLDFTFLFSLVEEEGQEPFSVSAGIGAEYNVFLERFTIVPSVLIGLNSQFPDSGFQFANLQSSLQLAVSYLFPGAYENVELYLEGGYVLRFALDVSVAGTSEIVNFGFGIRIR